MASYSEDDPLYMCSLCSNVFITEEEAEKHVCPNATSVTVIVEEEPAPGVVDDNGIASPVSLETYTTVPSTSSVLPSSSGEVVKPITKRKKDLGLFQAFAHNLNEDDDTVDSKTGWTVEATHTLIKVYKEFMDSRNPPWPIIAQNMQAMGYNVTPSLCDRRWDVIKKRYHRVTQGLSQGKASTKMTSFPYLLPLSSVIPVRDPEKEDWSDEEERCKLRKKFRSWTQDEENYFLNELKQKIINVTAPENKQSMDAMWLEIASELGHRGFHFSSKDCIQKWKSLVKQYRKVENEYKAEDYQAVFENFYIVMEIIQWFPQDYLANIQTLKSKDNQGNAPTTTNESYLPNSSVWPDEAVYRMLQELEKRQNFFNRAFSRKSIWRDICESMKCDGFNYHYTQTQGKWKSLKAKYRSGSLIDSPFYSIFKKLYHHIEEGGSEELEPLPSMEKTLETLPNVKSSMRKFDKTGMPWSVPATRALLELLYEEKERFATTRGLKQLFDEVSTKLNERGFRHDEEQCYSKWKTISKIYQKTKLNEEEGKKPYRRLPRQDIIRDLCELREHFKSLPCEKRKRVTAIKYTGGPNMPSEEGSADESSGEDVTGDPKHVSWSHDGVVNLISAYKEVFLKVKKESYNGKMFWKTVFSRLKKTNCVHSLEACKRKMQKLRDQYIRKSEKGEGGYNDLDKWPYSNAMREVLILKKQYDKKDPLCRSVGRGPYPHDLEENIVEQQITKRRETTVWDKDAAVVLMELYMERKDKFSNILEFRKKDLWEEMSQALEKCGFHYSADACDMKFKSMLRTYRKTVQHNSKSGNVKKLCPFYSNFKELIQYTPVTSKEQKELYKTLKKKSKELMIETQKKMETERQARIELEAKMKLQEEENKHKAVAEQLVKVREGPSSEHEVPLKVITLPMTPVLEDSELSNSSLGTPDAIISATFNAETGETRIESEVKTNMPADHPLAQTVVVEDETYLSDMGDTDIDSCDGDVMDYALSDLDNDVDMADDDDDDNVSLTSLSGSGIVSSLNTALQQVHSSSLSQIKTPSATKLSSPHMTSEQTVGEVFSLLQNYEVKQERRDAQMMDRMEQMQKNTLDVMKTLSALMGSR